MAKKEKLLIQDTEILGGPYRNFSGKEGKFNSEGDRFFNILVPEELVPELINDGWNVKPMKSDESKFHLKVKVSYRYKKPKIVTITSKGQRMLSEEDIDDLDWADILSADVYINPSHYNISGREGISAYLDALYVTIEEDPLVDKYSDVPVIGENIIDQEDNPF